MLITIEFFLVSSFFLYLLLKRDNTDDSFFTQQKLNDKNNLLEIISTLEKINEIDYSSVKKKIIACFADNELSEPEIDRLEEYLVYAYFKGFKKRFTPFKKADGFLKLIYIFTLICSFVYFNLIIYNAADSQHLINNNLIWWQIFLSVILFIVPVLFWLIQLGVISLILTGLSGLLPNKGSVFRAQITIDELIKLLKPGGRNTPVELGRPNMEDWTMAGGI